MHPWITAKLNQWKASGKLVIIAALLFELLVVLWLGFFALFALETLLPTFVTIHLSLSNFLTLLILGTVGYLFLERQFDEIPSQTKTPPWLSVGAWLFGCILITLSLARFSLIGALIFLALYLFLWWFLGRFLQEQ